MIPQLESIQDAWAATPGRGGKGLVTFHSIELLQSHGQCPRTHPGCSFASFHPHTGSRSDHLLDPRG